MLIPHTLTHIDSSHDPLTTSHGPSDSRSYFRPPRPDESSSSLTDSRQGGDPLRPDVRIDYDYRSAPRTVDLNDPLSNRECMVCSSYCFTIQEIETLFCHINLNNTGSAHVPYPPKYGPSGLPPNYGDGYQLGGLKALPCLQADSRDITLILPHHNRNHPLLLLPLHRRIWEYLRLHSQV